ncbi:MAG TPA: flagellar motor protein MotB [Thermoclostridium sp.]
MSIRRKRAEGLDVGGNWLTTYSDLVTNLLCFFVMLFSMSVIDAQKFEAIAKSLRSSLVNNTSMNGNLLHQNMGKRILTVNFVNPDDTGKKIVDNERYIETAESIILDDKERIREEKYAQVKKQIEKDFSELGIPDDLVDVIEQDNYLLVRLNSQILFKSGSAEILEEGKNTLNVLGESLKALDNNIIVEGHTDTVPIKTPMFPTNWELSTKRATNVVLYLVNELGIDPARLTASGCGEHKPIADNSTAEGRSKNRRIEFMIMK